MALFTVAQKTLLKGAIPAPFTVATVAGAPVANQDIVPAGYLNSSQQLVIGRITVSSNTAISFTFKNSSGTTLFVMYVPAGGSCTYGDAENPVFLNDAAEGLNYSTSAAAGFAIAASLFVIPTSTL